MRYSFGVVTQYYQTNDAGIIVCFGLSIKLIKFTAIDFQQQTNSLCTDGNSAKCDINIFKTPYLIQNIYLNCQMVLYRWIFGNDKANT